MEQGSWFTKQDLFHRGWNQKLIERFISPSGKAPNPHRRGTLLNLYSISEVEKAERSPEFREQMGKKRSNSTKTQASIKWANQVQINYTQDLSVLAISESLGNQDGRDILSFIRHKFTNYEKIMFQCDERFAPLEAKKVIRLRLLKLLTKSYSALRDGASRQWAIWYDEPRAF